MTQLESHKSLLPMFSVHDLKLQKSYSITRMRLQHFLHVSQPPATQQSSIMLNFFFFLHWCSNAISTKQIMSCFWLSEQKKKKRKEKKERKHLTKAHTFNCMGLKICLKITHICTGPRFTMHSSPMTEQSISG